MAFRRLRGLDGCCDETWPILNSLARNPPKTRDARPSATLLLFLGDVTEAPFAKAAFGLRGWAPERCAGECALPAATVTTGVPRLTPAQARARGARALVIGVANRGGVVAPAWLSLLLEALEAGLDLISGMHGRLAQDVRWREAFSQVVKNDRNGTETGMRVPAMHATPLMIAGSVVT